MAEIIQIVVAFFALSADIKRVSEDFAIVNGLLTGIYDGLVLYLVRNVIFDGVLVEFSLKEGVELDVY